MNAIVTGSSGFVGGHLVPVLMETGIKVVGIDQLGRINLSIKQAKPTQEDTSCNKEDLMK